MHAVLRSRGTKRFVEGQKLPPQPEAVGDYLFCEALGFTVKPWELDDLDVETFGFWAQVIGTYQDAKAKAELQRQKENQPKSGGRRR